MSSAARRIDPVKLLEGLTEPQRAAVTHTNGPLCVLAGAGSGKTRVITRRAAHLACTVTDARHVLAITFTNKAANEMRERIVALGVGADMTVRTFHSLCARLLRTYHERAGLSPNFTIFDDDDQRKVLKETIAKADLSTQNWTPSRVQNAISKAKNELLTAEEFAGQANDWSSRCIARIYRQYEAMLAEQQGMDFDDLLLRMALLLRRDEELCGLLERRFTHVLIDEYQDTNRAQYEIARRITQGKRNLCVTGDPDQSIYGWRGADIRNILDFEKDYPDAVTVRLEQNYRSTKRILSAASTVIARNRRRKKKDLWTENPDGPAVRVTGCDDGQDEARFIAEECRRHRDGGRPLKNIAVFYRINALSRSVEEEFLRAGIPYQVARGVAFYNRKEIKDVLAYLRVMVNPADEVSLLRIINTPARGIGDTTVKRLEAHAVASGQRLLAVIADPSAVPAIGKAVARVQAFAKLIGELTPLTQGPPRAAVEAAVKRSGLMAAMKEEATQNSEPLENVSELISAAADFEEEHPEAVLLDFLEHASLVNDVDSVDSESGAVTLMTLHAAKGLEFPVVYVIGLEEGLLPMRRDDSNVDVEEERRLCFVGMTRAMQELTLTHATYRMIRGMTERQVESVFLHELPKAEVEWIDRGEEAEPDKTHAAPDDDYDDWEAGKLVRHPKYGVAQVCWAEPAGGQTRVRLRFRNGRERTFIVEYADLERVDGDDAD